ncbi:MAG: site-specific DNA-methyltransferase [Nanoarchaeota archaeon]
MSAFLNKIINENCLSGLKNIPDGIIDCCISSPPYWGLRDYGHDEQLGSEENFEDFISKLIEIYTEIKRVLKPDGTCFINLGDTYGGSGSGTTKNADTKKYIENSKQIYVLPNGTAKASKFRGTALNKSLLMIPERFAIEMINMGWILRNTIIWHKPNQMPSSATDRFTVDFEKIFFFVKQQKYYFEQQLEPISDISLKRAEYGWNGKVMESGHASGGIKPMDKMGSRFANPEGRNMRTVWSVNTNGYSGVHFATYPEKLVERMLKAGCPKDGIVLDPFMGAGSTAVVARKLGMNFTGFELNKKYFDMANERLYKEIGMFL